MWEPLKLLPPLIAVVLAFVTREVVISLFAGVTSGFFLLQLVQNPNASLWTLIVGTFDSMTAAILEVCTDPDNASVIVLCLIIGGMISLINRTGGFIALAKSMTKTIKSPRAANIVSEMLGLLVFFDDYANSLIVGPVMRPITDKVGVSRERLAYVVDSTAAPATGIAIISSWIAVEISAIESGFKAIGVTDSAYNLYLRSIPYCFYCIICLGFVFAGSFLGREYGPMLQAEMRARSGQALKNPPKDAPEALEAQTSAILPTVKRRTRRDASPLMAVVPIAFLCIYAIVGFYMDGMQTLRDSGQLAPDAKIGIHLAAQAFGAANTVFILVKASLLSSLIALVWGLLRRVFNLAEGMEAWLNGASSLMITGVILVLAWTLSGTIDELGATDLIVKVVSAGVPAWLLPALVFTACCVISFGAGSYGCILIVMPMVIPLAYGMAEQAAHEGFIPACVAAVLSGAIFGDHCSPISDTTILSSYGSGCENIAHIKTQMPYALTVAVISAVCGSIPAGLGLNPFLSILSGLAIGIAILRIFGKKPEDELKKSKLQESASE